jgi:Fe-S cluster assembly protein SufD
MNAIVAGEKEKRFEFVRAREGEVELRVGPHAELDVVFFADPPAGANEKLAVRAFVGEGARLGVVAVDVGRGGARRDIEVVFEGPDGSAALRGLAVLGGEGQVRNATVVRHRSPRTTSRQVFKDILGGRSQSQYDGLVHIHREGAGSDSDQLNRNLLLSDDARADSRPQLKIDADDVKATHGSTTGQLPPEEVFYLRSRGLDPQAARALWMHGFAQDILQEIPAPEVRRDLEARVRNELERVAS